MTQDVRKHPRARRRNGDGPGTTGDQRDLRERLNVKWKLAKLLVDSGYLPAGVERPEQALFVILKGEELGLPPVQALTSINVIDGTPALSGALLMALCIRDAGCSFDVERREADGAAVTIYRPGWPPHTAEFTTKDAERAGLLGEGAWEQYPRAMYWWRAVSEACRTVCPDVVAGLYTPEELGAEGVEDGVPLGAEDRASAGDHFPSESSGRGLAERYEDLWADLVEDEEERAEARERFEAGHPRLPEDREAWGRTEYVVAVRTVEKAGRAILEDLATPAGEEKGSS